MPAHDYHRTGTGVDRTRIRSTIDSSQAARRAVRDNPPQAEQARAASGQRIEEADRVRPAWIDLYWLPLGAGGRFVRLNGRIYESGAALFQRRRPLDLYHSALEVAVGPDRWVIEVTPVVGSGSGSHGAVAEGPVGAGWAGRLSIFRYEIRRWPEGRIPDVDEAVESPNRLCEDPEVARRLLELTPQVPTATWGRDELDTGDMWNSNSVVSWLIARSGIDTAPIHPPAGGRAPGWSAGIDLAFRR